MPFRAISLRRRRVSLLLATAAALVGCAFLLLSASGRPVRAQSGGPSKVVVLGFDGADARLVERWMDEGKLPNLDRLRRTGSFRPLLPTNPPQTPVSWSTFATGLDPGHHRIFDFLKRDVDTYAPDFAMASSSTVPLLFGERNPLIFSLAAGFVTTLLLGLVIGLISRRLWLSLALALAAGGAAFSFALPFMRENVPQKRPIAINHRQGIPFWQILGEHGVRSTIIRVPQTFPPDLNPGGRLLSGLGVPDIRGTFGTYTLYTSDLVSMAADTEKGGKVVVLDVEPGDRGIDAVVYGPFNKLFDSPPEIHLPMRLEFDWEGRAVTIRLPDQELTLREGEWSDFVQFEFPIRKIVKVHGIARFKLLQMDDRVRLYLSAINIDPNHPVVPITEPPGFVDEIRDRIGLWKTLGWAVDTWALDEEVTDEETFAQDMDFTVTKFEEILHAFLEDPGDRLYTQIFYFTDRAGHMFWRFLDPDSPRNDAELAPLWGDFVLKSYERMDRIVGYVLDRLPPDGVLLVCSDHGFAAWQRSVNTNTWLVRNGFMSLKGQDEATMLTLDDLFVEGQFWPNVDWSRTRAYALGLGALYINVLGRERDGIVAPGAEYDATVRELKASLEAFVDTSTGIRPVSRVYTRDEMYRPGYDPDLIPDLRAANAPGYRVSWQTSLGGIPRTLFEPNEKKWSGDHCSLDPEEVKGILFTNRRLDSTNDPVPGIEDVAPTLLSIFGAPIPPEMIGAPLRFE